MFPLQKKDFTTLPVFPLRPNIIIGSLTQYQLIPFQRIFLKCYLNLTNPKCPEVYVVNNPGSCHIDTCGKKIQSEIIMQIKTLLRATFKNWWLWLRKVGKVVHERETRRSHINVLSVFHSFNAGKITMKTAWDVKTSRAWGKLLV